MTTWWRVYTYCRYCVVGVMTVLTMTFLAMDTRGDLPKVSYSTALDYFVATCFAFVLATIIQVSAIHSPTLS